MREAVRVEASDVTGDIKEQERALIEGVGAVRRRLEVLEVSGEQAVKFLDGQLSQDVAGISPGQSAWSFVLQPQGKVVALVRVTVVSPDQVLLDTEAGFGEVLVERLNRFRLRVKAELSVREVDAVSVRGPGALGVARSEGRELDALWPAWPGWDRLDSTDVPAGVMVCSEEAWELARIRSGLPRNGVDLDDKTIPAESGLVPVAASMTKGCYVGQELVARIDSRGHVNRHLRTLDVDGTQPPRHAELLGPDETKVVGSITSSAFSHVAGHPVALAYVRREIESGSTVRLRWADGDAKALVK